MRRIVVPGVALASSRLGFGTSSLHHVLRGSDRQRLLGAALDAGFTHFDTARMYGEGLAERELGRFSKGNVRQHVTIATKLGIPAHALFERLTPLMYAQRMTGGMQRRLGLQKGGRRRRDLSVHAAEDSLARSLKALATQYVDVLFIHEPSSADFPDIEKLAGWLENQKKSGRARYIGLAGSAKACVEVAERFTGLFEILQVEDSLEELEADEVTKAGHPMQVTFGYLRLARQALKQENEGIDPVAVVANAMVRNHSGLILVTTSRPAHLRALAAVASKEDGGS